MTQNPTQSTVETIERMAEIAGVSRNKLCHMAEISRSSLTVWKGGKSQPKGEGYERLKSTIAAILFSAPKEIGVAMLEIWHARDGGGE